MSSEWEMTGCQNRSCISISKVANACQVGSYCATRTTSERLWRNATLIQSAKRTYVTTGPRGLGSSEGTAKFEEERISHLVQKRQNRKERDTVTATEGACCCSVCGKVCLSRIGLFGHMKVHKKLGAVGGHGQIWLTTVYSIVYMLYSTCRL